jgi:ABC-type nitrate/sulfonate/bicarbonate transport system ATPase subunit
MSPVGDPRRLDAAIRSKIYVGASGQRRQALGEIVFALEKGQVGALVGPSGCGKTTVLRIVAGLERQFEGTVSSPEGRLAVVFQETRLLPWRRVEDNVRLVAPTIGDEELSDLFAALGLHDHRRHFPRELSLGLARRVALAQALAVRPDLLLLDEPFASLDSATTASLRDKIAEIVEARAVTTLMVTHDVESAVRLADQIFVLSPSPGRLLDRIVISDPRRLNGPAITEITARIRLEG